MTPRAVSFALALLLAAACAAVAAPPACCVPAGSGRDLIAGDCCSTMVECPLQFNAAGLAIVQADGQGPAVGPPVAAPESPTSVEPSRADFRFEPDELTYSGPPLYRLHAQLLI